MADLEFKVAKRRHEAITFTLEGQDHVYSFDPPKSAVMMMPVFDGTAVNDIGMTKATFDWMGAGLSEEDNARIMARLKDPDDDLDVDTLADVVHSLAERVGGRPSS